MLWLGAALAAQSGIVVHLFSNGLPIEDEVVCLLADGDDVVEVVLADNGESPDVGADDGRYAGAVMVSGNAFDVTVVVDGVEHAVGTASFEDDGSPRDLIVSWRDDTFAVEAGSPSPAGDVGQVTGTPTEGPSTASGPTSPPTATMPGGGGGGQDDSMLLIGLGVGLLVLAAIVLAWIRGSGGPGYRVKTSARLQPEPGFLGGPSLSEGLHTVKGSADTAVGVLEELARHHRVLVAGFEPPPVWGGPVYVAEGTKAVHIADAAEDLLGGPGQPLAVLVVGIDDLADQLPDGVGGLAFGDAGDWSLQDGQLVREDPPTDEGPHTVPDSDSDIKKPRG